MIFTSFANPAQLSMKRFISFSKFMKEKNERGKISPFKKQMSHVEKESYILNDLRGSGG